MRVLHTEWSDGWGGQEHRVLGEMRGLAGRGHTITLVTRPQCRIRTEAEKVGIPVALLPLRRASDLASIVALRRLLRERSIEVVHTHSGVDTWIASVAAKWAGTPVLLRTRHLNLPLQRNWLNFVHYLPDRIITCGDAMRTQLIETAGFPAGQLISIATGIDFDEFRPGNPRESVRAALGIAAADFIVLMVGIIRRVKRHEVALRAFQRLLPELSHARLVLAGDGPIRPEIERLAAELNVAGRVQFLGFRNDVADLMGASDLLLLTSQSEGVPQAVTQALGLGLPVVATRVGGVPELIQHERTGLLIPPEDPEAAAVAILRCAHEPETARRLGVAGREHALAHFSLKAMLDKVERLCLDLLSEKKRLPV